MKNDKVFLILLSVIVVQGFISLGLLTVLVTNTPVFSPTPTVKPTEISPTSSFTPSPTEIEPTNTPTQTPSPSITPTSVESTDSTDAGTPSTETVKSVIDPATVDPAIVLYKNTANQLLDEYDGNLAEITQMAEQLQKNNLLILDPGFMDRAHKKLAVMEELGTKLGNIPDLPEKCTSVDIILKKISLENESFIASARVGLDNRDRDSINKAYQTMINIRDLISLAREELSNI